MRQNFQKNLNSVVEKIMFAKKIGQTDNICP